MPVRLWHILQGFLCPRILFSQLMYDIYFSLPYLVVSHISVCSPDGFRRLFRCSFCPFFPAHFLTRYLLVFYLALFFFVVSAALTLCPACHSLSADLPCPPQKPLITRSWPLSFTGCAFFDFRFRIFLHAAAMSHPIYSVWPSLFPLRPPYCYNDAVIYTCRKGLFSSRLCLLFFSKVR